MVAEGTILESAEQKEFNERLLRKILDGSKLAEIMVEIFLHSEKTNGIEANLGNYHNQKMLAAVKGQLKGKVKFQTLKIEEKQNHGLYHNGVRSHNVEKTPCQYKQFVIFAQMGKKNKCADIFKNTVIDQETGTRMFEEKTETKYVKTKLKKVEKQLSIKKLIVF